MSFKKIKMLAYTGISYLIFFVWLVLTAKPTMAGDCFSHANECSEAQLCILATTNSDGVKKWTTDSDYFEYVLRAKELGVKCGIEKMSSYCPNEPTSCSPEELCKKAITIKNGIKTWNVSKKASIYVKIAKSKNLNCGVINKKTSFSPNIKEVQKELNRVGCDAGAADGILGKKTLRALERYRSQVLVQFDLPKIKNDLFFRKMRIILNAENTMKNCLQTKKNESDSKIFNQDLKENLNDIADVKDSIFKLFGTTVKCAVHLALLNPLCGDGSERSE